MSTLLLKVAAVPVMMESVDATPVNSTPLPKKLVAVIDSAIETFVEVVTPVITRPF